MNQSFAVYDAEEARLVMLVERCEESETLLEFSKMMMTTVLIGMSYVQGLKMIQHIVHKTRMVEAQDVLRKWIVLHGTENEIPNPQNIDFL